MIRIQNALYCIQFDFAEFNNIPIVVSQKGAKNEQQFFLQQFDLQTLLKLFIPLNRSKRKTPN